MSYASTVEIVLTEGLVCVGGECTLKTKDEMLTDLDSIIALGTEPADEFNIFKQRIGEL